MAQEMHRRIWKWIFSLLAVVFLLFGSFWGAKKLDIFYTLRETLSGGLYHYYDPLIAKTAQRHGLDPNLVKAVIWRESHFHTDKLGASGERGLMQVTAPAGSDWAKAMKRGDFQPEQLSKPETNLEVGCWYLARALMHWKDRDHPLPFALAEYNAGRSRVRRWVNSSGKGEEATADNLRTSMDFPSTKAYVKSILARCKFYQARDEFPAQLPD